MYRKTEFNEMILNSPAKAAKIIKQEAVKQKGNRVKIAEALGMDRSTLYRSFERLNEFDVKEYVQAQAKRASTQATNNTNKALYSRVKKALKLSGGNITQAAAAEGVGEGTFHVWMKKLDGAMYNTRALADKLRAK